MYIILIILDIILIGTAIRNHNTYVRLKRAIKRNAEVYDFISYVVANYPPEVYYVLPSYSELLFSDVELTLDNFIENIEDFKPDPTKELPS